MDLDLFATVILVDWLNLCSRALLFLSRGFGMVMVVLQWYLLTL
jgi:hypothetical protein